MKRALFGVGGDAVIFNDEEHILLLKRSDNDPYKPGTWDLPGGIVEYNEDPYSSIQREVKEETGLEIEILCPFAIDAFYKDLPKVNVLSIKYIARCSSSAITLSSEHNAFKWCSIDSLPKDIDKRLLVGLQRHKSI